MGTLKGTLTRLVASPHYSLANWPTPLERHELPNGPVVWVKRDDLSGWGRGGAKARKIEHLLGHMLARGYTDLVTVAGNVTNLAFDLIPALERAGIAGHLHIIDDPPVMPSERVRIFRGIAQRVTLLGPSRAEAFQRTWLRWLELRREGRRPLWVLPGISHPAGILGNAAGYLELVEQFREASQALPTTLFITAATGTTVAGFLMAERLRRERGERPIRIVGVQIYEGRTRAATRWLMRWAALSTGQRLPLTLPVDVASDSLSGGFGKFAPALTDLCERVQRDTGLLIDPIFGGKTWASMEREIERTKPRDEEFLYWHCGYTPEWRTLGKVVNGS